MSNELTQMRSVFFETWNKYIGNKPLEPLEAMLMEILLAHPEYHAMLENPATDMAGEFNDHNPFLHLSLHLGLREQIKANRPIGIAEIYSNLCKKYGDIHQAEHKMMECLGQILWDAQQAGKMPEEEIYLDKLQNL